MKDTGRSDGEANRRIKVLYVSFIPPVPTMGSAMTFYRHFIERSDFEIKVVTSCGKIPTDSVPYQPVKFGPSRLMRRLFRTRLLPWLYGPHSLITWGRVPPAVWQAAREFKPDLVFTLVASWDYSALMAERVARKLHVPLVASFNDWFNYGWFPAHPIYHRLIERRFRRFYREADLAFCTCEGMREALGPHPNAHILYPTGAAMPDTLKPLQRFRAGERRFIVGFAGSLENWYGQMLERLVLAAQARSAPVEFRFFGSKPSWSREFDGQARAQKIYRGHLPFEQLRQEMAQADALILPMGFETECALAERTSFKTKFLDYLAHQKPILVWGPEYCSAVRVAREFDSAEICTQPAAAAMLDTILAVANHPERQSCLVQNARKMYDDRFNAGRIHGVLVEQCRQIVARKSKAWAR